ncbi:MAG TPA: hypothetical protein VMT17_06370 [Anaeromyxobacteraceae bacterium]|nr:hypothetical protein [Anaeromyxobacteraceae bacterium]
MAKRDRKAGADLRLQGLFEAGDWRQARAEARRLRASSPEAEPAVREVVERMRPDPSAVWAGAVGVLLLAAVASLGLLHR